MGAAICGCVALIAVLAAIHEQRRIKHRPKTAAEDQNALDRGLALLIKDISRHRDAPLAAARPIAPSHSSPLLAPRPGPALPLHPRPARGTPSDAVLIGTRLRALPEVPVVPPAPPPDLFDLFDDDDDDAPTTLASAYVDSPSPTTPVRVGRH